MAVQYSQLSSRPEQLFVDARDGFQAAMDGDILLVGYVLLCDARRRSWAC